MNISSFFAGTLMQVALKAMIESFTFKAASPKI